MPGIVETVRAGVPVAKAQVICVFVHGRNQSPEEMQAAVLCRLRAPAVAYVLPRAEDKCWYRALAVDPLTPDTRAELARSLSDLADLITGLRAEATNVPVVLAGFSQGACLSLEHGFTGGAVPDAIAAMTGCRVGHPGDDRPARWPRGLPAYLTAGSADPWIPLQAFAQAAAAVGAAEAPLRMDVFPARPHEVSAAECAMLDTLLADVAAGRPPSFGAVR